jgi:hypothetical protein
MGREPIEVVHRIHEAWAEGAGAHGLIAEDVTYVNPPNAVESGTRHGSDTFNRVNDVYERFRPHVAAVGMAGEPQAPADNTPSG